MSEIVLKSEIDVELIQQCGTDETIAHAAWVSTKGATPLFGEGGNPKTDKVRGVIHFLMRERHGSPFEHGLLTVRVHAPVKVFREWHRHRAGWAYSEESGRYRNLDPVFYLPPPDRPAIRPPGFKSSRPHFDMADETAYAYIATQLAEGYRQAYSRYQDLLAAGCDRGLARDVLGVGIYSACYCSANPRSLMHFLELRTDHPEAKRPSKPLHEIRVAADKLEAIFAAHWPVTYAAWVECGRAAP
jgi:thymidylate synthase (FAD)